MDFRTRSKDLLRRSREKSDLPSRREADFQRVPPDPSYLVIHARLRGVQETPVEDAIGSVEKEATLEEHVPLLWYTAMITNEKMQEAGLANMLTSSMKEAGSKYAFCPGRPGAPVVLAPLSLKTIETPVMSWETAYALSDKQGSCELGFRPIEPEKD